MTPFRDDPWNLPTWIYPIHWTLVIACGALVVYGLWRRARLWRMGQPAARTDQIGRRIGGLLLYALGQGRVLSQAYPGLMHGLIFYSFGFFHRDLTDWHPVRRRVPHPQRAVISLL